MLLQMVQKNMAPDLLVLELTGRITLGRSCQELEWELNQLAEKHKKIIVDLAAVDRLDSSGIGILVLSAGKVKAGGGEMVLAGARGNVADVLKLTQVDSITRTFPDVAAAGEALSGGSAAGARS